MKTDNIDLGKYDINQLLRNPATIHKIQDNLEALKGDGLFVQSIRQGAVVNIKQAIKEVIEQYRDNPELIKKIIGKETLGMIEEFEGITLADDIKNVL